MFSTRPNGLVTASDSNDSCWPSIIIASLVWWGAFSRGTPWEYAKTIDFDYMDIFFLFERSKRLKRSTQWRWLEGGFGTTRISEDRNRRSYILAVPEWPRSLGPLPPFNHSPTRPPILPPILLFEFKCIIDRMTVQKTCRPSTICQLNAPPYIRINLPISLQNE